MIGGVTSKLIIVHHLYSSVTSTKRISVSYISFIVYVKNRGFDRFRLRYNYDIA